MSGGLIIPDKEIAKARRELFGNSEQLDTISRADAIALAEEVENKRLRGEIDLTYAPMINGIKALPSAQQIPWDKNTRNSMVNTLQMLRRLAYNIHGVMDAIDDDNVMRLIEWLEGGEP